MVHINVGALGNLRNCTIVATTDLLSGTNEQDIQVYDAAAAMLACLIIIMPLQQTKLVRSASLWQDAATITMAFGFVVQNNNSVSK